MYLQAFQEASSLYATNVNNNEIIINRGYYSEAIHEQLVISERCTKAISWLTSDLCNVHPSKAHTFRYFVMNMNVHVSKVMNMNVHVSKDTHVQNLYFVMLRFIYITFIYMNMNLNITK